MLNTAVCTLFENDYHYGVGALTNSLCNQGFRGVVWAGYRGQLPDWAQSGETTSIYQELSIIDGCTVKFVKLNTKKHLAFYKPDFMLEIFQHYDPEIDAVFYFDPDIVNKAKWDFYQRWVERGIALCGDCWYSVPARDPRRLAWQDFAEAEGFTCQRQLDHHYNSGFIGVNRRQLSFLQLWQQLIEIGGQKQVSDLSSLGDEDLTYRYPYLYTDQSYMNLGLMLSNETISPIGPEGMDFLPGGTIMSHATSPSVKPWRKKLIQSALEGCGPTSTDKLYWQNAIAPIPLYSDAKFQQYKLSLLISSAIGRFIRRPAI